MENEQWECDEKNAMKDGGHADHRRREKGLLARYRGQRLFVSSKGFDSTGVLGFGEKC